MNEIKSFQEGNPSKESNPQRDAIIPYEEWKKYNPQSGLSERIYYEMSDADFEIYCTRERQKSNHDSLKSPSRRRFLKAGGGAAAATLVATIETGALIEKALRTSPAQRGEESFFTKQEERYDFTLDLSETYDGQHDVVVEPTAKQTEIEQQNTNVIGQTFEQQVLKGKEITLDRSTKEAIYAKWHDLYGPDGREYPILIKGLERMQPWLSEIRKQFALDEIDHKYAYLAIVESGFILDAQSAYARGPFQFTKDTGRRYELKIIPGKYDERLDPVLAARACTRHIKDSLRDFNNDKSLAVAGYNGGFPNSYRKYKKKRGEDNLSYDDFLLYRQKNIREYVEERHAYYEKEDYPQKNGAGLVLHTVKSGEVIGTIAAAYGTTAEVLKELNKFSSLGIIIKPGQKIALPKNADISALPSKGEWIRQSILKDLSDSSQNLNYPEKFYAAYDSIKENNLEEQFPATTSLSELCDQIPVPQGQESLITVTVKKGTGYNYLAGIVKERLGKYKRIQNISISDLSEEIQRQNGNKALHPGNKISLHVRITESYSLQRMANARKIDVSLLQRLNPAVEDITFPLPDSVKIRIPKKETLFAQHG